MNKVINLAKLKENWRFVLLMGFIRDWNASGCITVDDHGLLEISRREIHPILFRQQF